MLTIALSHSGGVYGLIVHQCTAAPCIIVWPFPHCPSVLAYSPNSQHMKGSYLQLFPTLVVRLVDSVYCTVLVLVQTLALKEPAGESLFFNHIGLLFFTL